MKILIFYFSGTGNTYYVAEQIKSALSEENEVKIQSIESPQLLRGTALEEEIMASDIIGIGYPIYGSDYPKIMRSFIEKLPNLLEKGQKPKKTLVFCSELIASGNGAYFTKKILKNKGYQITWAVHFQMPNNICIPQSPFKYSLPESKKEKIKLKAKNRAEKLSQRISNGEKWIQGRNIFSKIIGDFQRVLFRLEFERYNKKWGVDMEKCTHCKRCVNICPVDNIQLINNQILHGNNCIFCMRCYNYCPTQAISYAGKFHKKDKPIPYRGPTKDFRPELLKK